MMTWSHRTGLWWASWRLRRRELFTVDIRSALSRGGTALVLLPDDEELLKCGLEACSVLSSWFQPIHLMVLSQSSTAPDVTGTGHPTLSLPNAINRWGLPYRPVIRRVAEIAPQVAISLHPEFHLASAYLCVLSGAPLRIGFSGPADGYFNLQYIWRDIGGADATDHFRGFLAMLADLRSSALV